ncbi:hypothetical protein [Streptomyces sp. NPDC001205]
MSADFRTARKPSSAGPPPEPDDPDHMADLDDADYADEAADTYATDDVPDADPNPEGQPAFGTI